MVDDLASHHSDLDCRGHLGDVSPIDVNPRSFTTLEGRLLHPEPKRIGGEALLDCHRHDAELVPTPGSPFNPPPGRTKARRVVHDPKTVEVRLLACSITKMTSSSGLSVMRTFG